MSGRGSESAGGPGATRRAPGALAKAALLVASFAVAGLLAEAGVRLAFGPQVKFPRHVVGAPWGVRTNEPGAVYRHRSADVDVGFRINAQGLRADRDYAYAKPPGVRRIVSLGDSFTIGYEVEVEETFSSVLERELRARGRDVEVLNAGVSGFSNAEALVYLERELLRYAPDLVLVTFFENDLEDNVRSGLFRLEEDRLVAAATSYVPAGALGDALNKSSLLSLLSEHSDAFALFKESMTLAVKRGIVLARLRSVDVEATIEVASADELDYQRRLCAAIFERMYAVTREAGIPLLIHSLPNLRGGGELVDSFPSDRFDARRPGVALLASREVLEPFAGRERLYWTRSHWHWTPRSHELAGRALAERIVRDGMLP
jgi:hypothetical protein